VNEVAVPKVAVFGFAAVSVPLTPRYVAAVTEQVANPDPPHDWHPITIKLELAVALTDELAALVTAVYPVEQVTEA